MDDKSGGSWKLSEIYWAMRRDLGTGESLSQKFLRVNEIHPYLPSTEIFAFDKPKNGYKVQSARCRVFSEGSASAEPKNPKPASWFHVAQIVGLQDMSLALADS
ncbi:MAG: hypothetical protein N3B10_11155 [Armatimonadetes bacterium]|nr:hypothetical protein [Armatimonadota bacterium]